MGRVSGKPGRDPEPTALERYGRSPFQWTDQRIEAARLLGEGDLTDKEICQQVPVAPAALYRWKQHPAFMERVRAAAVEAEDAAVSRGFGRKGRRIQALTHHVNLLDQIVFERGEHYAQTHPDVPGSATGLLAYEETVLKTTVKNDRTGRVFKEEQLVTRRWAVDAALIRERRALLMQVSKEVGGIVDRTMNLNLNVEAGSDPPPDLESLAGSLLSRLTPTEETPRDET
jgi:hypothetical protein